MRIFRAGLYFSVIALAFMSATRADIASVSYVNRYYRETCRNPDLQVPDASGIASVSYVLGIIDTINNDVTSYATDTTRNVGIAATSYLPGVLSLLDDSATTCCLGGYYDSARGACSSCGDWSTTATVECLAAGQYKNGSRCSACPDGFLCPAGTNGRVLDTVTIVQCLNAGEYRYHNECHACAGGYMCPAGQNTADDCGAGYYCVDNTRYECDGGEYRCPLANHADVPSVLACDDTVVLAPSKTIECLAAGVYRNGSTCSACPRGFYCPAGTNGRVIDTVTVVQCLAAGEYRYQNECHPCPDGYLCPAAQNDLSDCGAGYYCTGNQRHECPDGARQCPLSNHTELPTRVACDETYVFTEHVIDDEF